MHRYPELEARIRNGHQNIILARNFSCPLKIQIRVVIKIEYAYRKISYLRFDSIVIHLILTKPYDVLSIGH